MPVPVEHYCLTRLATCLPSYLTLLEMVTQVKINAKEHPIADVTVYRTDSAVVQRHFPVELKVRSPEPSPS